MFEKTKNLPLLFVFLCSTALAQIDPQYQKDAAGSKDHLLLKRVEGSVILKYTTKKFDSHQVPLERVVFDYDAQKFKDRKKLKVEGARTTIFYRLPKDATTLEALRSYQDDLKGKGFEVLYEGSSGGSPSGETNTSTTATAGFSTRFMKMRRITIFSTTLCPGPMIFVTPR